MKKSDKPPEKPQKTPSKTTKGTTRVKSTADTKKTAQKPKEKSPRAVKAAAVTKKKVQAEVAKRKEEFLQIFQLNMCIVASSCRKAGISRKTFYEWKNNDPDFAQRCEDIEELQKDLAEAAMLKQIKDGNTTMIIFYAKTKMKDRGYGERVEVEHHTEKVIDFSKLSDKELIEYNKLIEKMSAKEEEK